MGILWEDFDAFKFEKNDLGGSLPCFGEVFGDAGKGGSEVKPGDDSDVGVFGGSVAVEAAAAGAAAGEIERSVERSAEGFVSFSCSMVRVLGSDSCGSFSCVSVEPAGPDEDSTGPGMVRESLAVFAFTMLNILERLLADQEAIAPVSSDVVESCSSRVGILSSSCYLQLAMEADGYIEGQSLYVCGRLKTSVVGGVALC